jgi:hypothetical protein
MKSAFAQGWLWGMLTVGIPWLVVEFNRWVDKDTEPSTPKFPPAPPGYYERMQAANKEKTDAQTRISGS